MDETIAKVSLAGEKLGDQCVGLLYLHADEVPSQALLPWPAPLVVEGSVPTKQSALSLPGHLQTTFETVRCEQVILNEPLRLAVYLSAQARAELDARRRGERDNRFAAAQASVIAALDALPGTIRKFFPAAWESTEEVAQQFSLVAATALRQPFAPETAGILVGIAENASLVVQIEQEAAIEALMEEVQKLAMDSANSAEIGSDVSAALRARSVLLAQRVKLPGHAQAMKTLLGVIDAVQARQKAGTAPAVEPTAAPDAPAPPSLRVVRDPPADGV